MKLLIRLLLLLSFSFLNESGVSAHSVKETICYAGAEFQPELANGDFGILQFNHHLHYAASSILKKEYRKIRGMKEEEDEDEKIGFLEKDKNHRSMVFFCYPKTLYYRVPYTSERPAVACLAKPRFFAQDSYCLPSHQLYTLYQVFRI